MARKVVQSTVNSQWDENGELKEKRESKTYTLDEEPPYVKLYLDTILFLRSLPKGYNPILLAFLKRMTYAEQGQVIYFNACMKKDIAKELGVSLSYINNAITGFVKGKIMFRIGEGKQTGTYQFNAHLFGKGKWEKIEEIRAKILFNAEGTDFDTEVVRYDKIAANKTEQAQDEADRLKKLEEQGQTNILDFVVMQEQAAAAEPETQPKCHHCGSTELDYRPEGPHGAWYKCKKCGKGTSANKRGA